MNYSSVRTLPIAVIALAGMLSGAPALAQPSAVPADTVIKLERTSCFGACPVYSVTLDGTGAVTYDGVKYVHIVGRQADRVAISRIAAILEAAQRIGFFELRDHYRTIENPDGSRTIVTDLPTTIVTITSGGRTKRVEDYLGAPDALKELEQQIDDIARTRRWIRPEEHILSDSRPGGARPRRHTP